MATASDFMTNFKNRHESQRKKRKTTKQQVKDAEKALLARILVELRDGKRSIPKDWERGYFAAMSTVERIEI